MFIVDNVHIPNIGNLIINISEDGKFYTINDSSVNYEFIIVFRSLDSNLISNVMYHHCGVGYDMWTYDYNIHYIKDILHKNHPGFSIEIYNQDWKNLLFKKNYHGVKKYRCLDLKSKLGDITHPSYYTFFNDECFLENFNIRDGDIVYDLGANIGAFSIACANYNVKKIYAFEPHPEIFDYLNFNLSKYARNVDVYNKAITNAFGRIKFGSIESSVSSNVNQNGSFEVDSINLEEFVLRNNLELPTYIKIDIEGSEYDFFNSTSDNFFKNTRSIFFEFHYNDGINVQKIIDRFINLGYTLNCKENVLDHTLSHMNTIYLNKL